MTEPITHNIIIENISAVEAVAIKHQLVSDFGLIDGQDFTWAWCPEVLDDFSYFVTRPKQLELRFNDRANATFFSLKFAHASA